MCTCHLPFPLLGLIYFPRFISRYHFLRDPYRLCLALYRSKTAQCGQERKTLHAEFLCALNLVDSHPLLSVPLSQRRSVLMAIFSKLPMKLKNEHPLEKELMDPTKCGNLGSGRYLSGSSLSGWSFKKMPFLQVRNRHRAIPCSSTSYSSPELSFDSHDYLHSAR